MVKIGKNARVRAIRNVDGFITAGMIGTVYDKCGHGIRDVIWDDFIGGHGGEANDGSCDHWAVDKADLEMVYTAAPWADDAAPAADGARQEKFEIEFRAATRITTSGFGLLPADLPGILVAANPRNDDYALCEFPGWGAGHDGAEKAGGYRGKDRWFVPHNRIRELNLTVEAGKYYRTRHGETVGPMVDAGTEHFRFEAPTGCWNRDGSWWFEPHEKDLLAEVPGPVVKDDCHAFKAGDLVRCNTGCKDEFTVGKLYVVRDVYGDRIGIVEDDRGGKTNGWNANCFEPVRRPQPGDKVTLTATVSEAFADGSGINVHVENGLSRPSVIVRSGAFEPAA